MEDDWNSKGIYGSISTIRLTNYPDGVTMFELKLAGYDFKTGSINTLITKGLVVTDGEREFACDIVYNGKVVGKTTKTGKVYKLVKKD